MSAPITWDDYEIFKKDHTHNGVVDYIAMLRYVEENHEGIGMGFAAHLMIDSLIHIMEKMTTDGK